MFFNKSHTYLDQIGVPRLDSYSANAIIKNIDFGQARVDGRIEYRDDGVYLFVQGKWIRGYYYMADYDVDRYETLPRFHLFNCPTMQNRQMYIGTYIWSNSDLNDVKQRGSDQHHKDQNLNLCSNCSNMFDQQLADTKAFFDSNDATGFELSDVVTDITPSNEHNIYGYPTNWSEIATAYKKEKGICCADCGISENGKEQSWFYDVHHINGDKSACATYNLKILCKLCHTYEDTHHINQARKYPNRNLLLHEFVRKNKARLAQNKYLTSYESDFKIFLGD